MNSRLAELRAALCRTGVLAAGLCVAGLCAAASWLPEPPVLPPVTLQDQDGRSVRFDELLRGRSVVLNFMFTGCSNVCPPQTAILRALHDEQGTRAGRPLLLSITVDPLGDGPAQLRDYAKRFELRLGAEHDWLFLTGGEVQVRRVMAAFGERSGAPEAHAGLVWVGHADSRRWTRVAATNGPALLARLAREAAP